MRAVIGLALAFTFAALLQTSGSWAPPVAEALFPEAAVDADRPGGSGDGSNALIPAAYGQGSAILNLTGASSEPCIFNSSAPHRILQNCAPQGRWLEFSLVGWQWITGGNLSAMIAATLILATWIKYQTAIYPLFIGIIFMPFTYFLFPQEFLSFAFVLAALACGIAIWWVFVRGTSEGD